MKTELTEFSYEELQFLSLAMEEKTKDCLSKIAMIEKFEDGETKTELTQFWIKQMELSSLWCTQTYNASVQVKIKEMVQSN